jgi:hypothetical protein
MSNLQDYTGYAEVDTASRLTVAANILTITALDTDEAMQLTYDFGASYFSGDFEHSLNFKVTVGTETESCYLWGMSDSIANPIGTLITANTDLIALGWTNGALILTERNSTVSTTDTSSALSLAMDYYLRIVRDESVGTYGTLYCYIYTDREYCELVDTISVTLTELKDWRYLWAASSVGNGAGSTVFTGTIANLTLDVYPYTLKGIRTGVRDLLDEDTPELWSNAELNYLINDGIREIAVFSGCIQNIDSLSTTNGTRTVSFTGHDVETVEYLASTPVSLIEIHPVKDGRLANHGKPLRWWQGNAQIGIEPLPDATYALNGYIYDKPTDLTVDSQIPEIPPVFRPLVVLYVCHVAYFKRSNVPVSDFYKQIYQGELGYTTRYNLVNLPTARSETRYD